MEKLKGVAIFLYKNFGPLIVFYIANHFWGLKTAILVSVIFTIIEVIQLRYSKKEITTFFKFSVAMTLVFGTLDLTLENAFFYKIEASVTNVFTAFFFGVTLFQSKPLIQQFAEQQGRTSKDQSQDKTFFFRLLTFIWMIYFIAKAFAYLWINLNSDVEQGLISRIIIGNISFGIMLFFSIGLARPFWNLLVKLKAMPSSRKPSRKAKFGVLPSNPEWPNVFESFQQKLAKIFGENLTAIYHIGSTSVKGLSARPVIDILVTVFSLDQVDKMKSEFEKEGFQWRGELGISGRRYMTLDDANGSRICDVYIFETSSLEVEKYLAFRDLMRSDFAKCKEYEKLKLKLFSEFPEGKDPYETGKADFIQTNTSRALEIQNHFRIPTQVYVWIVCMKEKEPKYLMFKRTAKSGGFWQGITGAPFSNEKIEIAAMRELFEETSIGPYKEVMSLDFAYCFPLIGEWRKSYRSEVEKVVEKVFYTFVDDFVEPQLSHEHEQFKWCSYQESLELLKWPNNKDSLHVLHQRLAT